MSKKEKLIKRLLNLPKDFRFEELESLLRLLGFEQLNKGRTSGSRVLFYQKDGNAKILIHKPHPSPNLKVTVLKEIAEYLMDNKFI